jgi:hypothetical protein
MGALRPVRWDSSPAEQTVTLSDPDSQVQTLLNSPDEDLDGLSYYSFSLLVRTPKAATTATTPPSESHVYLNLLSDRAEGPKGSGYRTREIRDGMVFWYAPAPQEALGEIGGDTLSKLHAEVRIPIAESAGGGYRYFYCVQGMARWPAGSDLSGNLYEDGQFGTLVWPRVPFATLPQAPGGARAKLPYTEPVVTSSMGDNYISADFFGVGRLDLVSWSCWIEEAT